MSSIVSMFSLISLFAIFGTACFMMALASIWYSPMLFGNAWMREVGISDTMLEEAQKDKWKHVLLTFISFSVMLGFLSYMVAYAPKLGFRPIELSFALSVFFASAMVAPTLFEGRSLRYYGIKVGFYVLFIMLGTLVLEYWPW